MLIHFRQIFFEHEVGEMMTDKISSRASFKLQASWVHTLDVARPVEGETGLGL